MTFGFGWGAFKHSFNHHHNHHQPFHGFGFLRQVVIGTNRDDTLFGTGRTDLILGKKGDDIIFPGGKGDMVDGGKGFDIVVYRGGIGDYDIDMRGSASKLALLVTDLTAWRTPTDILRNVEALYFKGDDYLLYVDGTNNAVLAADDAVTLDEDGGTIDAAALLANDREFDGDTMAVVAVSPVSAAGATVTLAGGVVSYDPGSLFDALGEGETATDTFTYTVDDGYGGTDEATVTVTITGRNDAPELTFTAAVQVAENGTDVPAGLSATDAEGDALVFAIAGGADAARFVIDPATGALSFAEAPDYEAPGDVDGDNLYEVTVSVSDGAATTTADLTVEVTDVAEAPEVEARLNEFHYDNAGTDAGEFVEVRARATDDVSQLAVHLYNGNGGGTYGELLAADATVTSDGTWQYLVWDLPANGIQNGPPDGLALSNGGTLIEFLSYEGTFEATSGPAAGVTSTDIGVLEDGTGPLGFSLQRSDDGSWRVPEAETKGADNVPVAEPLVARINEFHYDNAGTDAGEFVEVRVARGADTSGMLLELYNGNGGALYGGFAASAAAVTSDADWDYYVFTIPGIQNGAPDGLALSDNGTLIEFLSYEGAFTAVGGAADGTASTDVGVLEDGTEAAGLSLQRNADGSWRAPEPETTGAANEAAPEPLVARINEFHYDNAGTDTGEFIEVRVEKGADTSAMLLELYNGNGGAVYGTFTAAQATVTSDAAWDYYVFQTPGLQNGAPDGIALSNGGALIEFLSYEGGMTGVGGAADGVAATDIGVIEGGSGPVGDSLQRNADGSWRESGPATEGATNDPFSARINEVHYDNASGDVGEFVEVRVTAGGDASGLVLELYNGNGGAVYSTLPASAASVTSDGTWDYYVFDTTGIQNGAPDGMALSNGGELIEFLSYEGTFAGVGGAADGITSTDIGVVEDGTGPVGESLQRNEDGSWRASSGETRGAANDAVEQPTELFISQVQGSGYTSTWLDQLVRVSAVVTYITPDGFFLQEEDADADGDAATSEGIFVFAASGAAVALGDLVSLTGRVVENFGLTAISGTTNVVIEDSDVTLPTSTQLLLSPDVTPNHEALEGMLVSVSSGIPDRLTVIENFDLDRFGEIVVSAGVQYQPTQLYDAQTQQAEIADLMEANANARLLLDDNTNGQNPDQFEFLPGGAGDNGNGYLDTGDDFGDAGTTVRLGAEVARPIEGVMSYAFGDYRVLVSDTIEFDESTNSGARPATAPDVGGDFQVASVNVLNFFSTLIDGPGGSGPNNLEPRGANNAAELARQTEKLVANITGLDAEVLALQEIENNGFDASSGVGTLIAALNADPDTQASGKVYAAVDPTGVNGFVGDDAIMPAIIYDDSLLDLVSATLVTYDEPSAAATFALAEVLNPYVPASARLDDLDRNRPSVVATFVEPDSGKTFTVVSSHFKSKGDSGLVALADAAQAYLDGGGTGFTQADVDALRADPNFDQGDGQGFWNGVRLDAAMDLAEFMATYDAGSGGFILLGDMNSYAEEDAVQYLDDDAGLVDLIDEFLGQSGAYSYVFDGMRGTLDQGLASTAFAGAVTGVGEWHINADEPDLIGYDTSFNDPAYYNPGPYASSDHDPLLVGVSFDLFV